MKVADHPYESLLLKSAIPIAIPHPRDFPEIRFLEADQIKDEIALASAKHERVASDSAEAMSALRQAFGLDRGGIAPEAIQHDVEIYTATLRRAQELGLGLVSFYE